MKFLLIFPLLFWVSHTTLFAASFTADAVQTRGENISYAKMYWLDGNVRFEYVEDGVPMVQIFDNKKNKIIWLDNENKYFLIRDMPENEKVVTRNKKPAAKNKKNINPCQQFVDAECVFLKKTKINGRAAEKWLITLSNNGHDFHIFQWIDLRYKNILRQENSDGSGLTVDIKDDQEINSRKVRKLTMVAYSASGEEKQGVQWYDNELDVVVKQQYQNDIIDELRNIKVEKVSKNLFAVPEGYNLFDNTLKTAQQMDADTAEDKHLGNTE